LIEPLRGAPALSLQLVAGGFDTDLKHAIKLSKAQRLRCLSLVHLVRFGGVIVECIQRNF
jgi:hypothetical protein